MAMGVESNYCLTSRQILASPKEAVYVAINPSHVLYVRSLAAHLRRADLKIVAPGWLANNFAGVKVAVVDHGVYIGLIPSSQRLLWRRAIEQLSDRQSLITASSLAALQQVPDSERALGTSK